jgi:transcriptional regulator
VIVQIHLTAKNPLVSLADGSRRFLLIVSGDDAYVSNDWYASRDNVSTWLYEAVHLSGVAHLRERDDNRAHGDTLLAVSEARLPKQPWDLTQMEPTKRETMLASIRVIDLVVDEVEGQSKLNQHKSDEDHVAVANQLARAAEGWPSGCGRCGRSWGMTLSSSADEPTGRARHPCCASTKQTRC